ncbi:hypothetical protein DXT99_21930 [Pontibacter diazotrophicus]|uniref:Uncharacterized protein n=1 Tax=Pontibacter diazotrophicus TaxID=1400979 RepID=A0A3D8L6L4_9BACT|nr:hypothetical protein [Pontibacter diazotrophicus]RDV13038.1 hypothetical protein DXT99_21930 [Pontibacter diazotrophicus]
MAEKINKKDYPLVLLKAVQKMHEDVRAFVEENISVVEITRETDFEIDITDVDTESNFKFLISNPKYANQNVSILVVYSPESIESTAPRRFNIIDKSLLEHLTYWVKLVRSYDNIRTTKEEKVLREYEEEFFDKFEIIDEDADVKPYNLEIQLAFDKFLTHTIKVLEEDKEENQPLIDEATDFKENLTKLTKKETIRRLSKLFAKVRQKSLSLVNKIFEEAKKEGLKRLIGGGFDSIGGLLESVI